MDLVDAITEWSERVEEELLADDIDAILRVQLAIDDSSWSGQDVSTLTAIDVDGLKAHLVDVDASEFVAWVIDKSLAEMGVVHSTKPAPITPATTGDQPKSGLVAAVKGNADSAKAQAPVDKTTEDTSIKDTSTQDKVAKDSAGDDEAITIDASDKPKKTKKSRTKAATSTQRPTTASPDPTDETATNNALAEADTAAVSDEADTSVGSGIDAPATTDADDTTVKASQASTIAKTSTKSDKPKKTKKSRTADAKAPPADDDKDDNAEPKTASKSDKPKKRNPKAGAGDEPDASDVRTSDGPAEDTSGESNHTIDQPDDSTDTADYSNDTIDETNDTTATADYSDGPANDTIDQPDDTTDTADYSDGQVEAETGEELLHATSGGFARAANGAAAFGGAVAADADVFDDAASTDFFSELERNVTRTVTGPAAVELRQGPDSLGPTFLPPARTNNKRSLGLVLVSAVALAAFVFVGMRLLDGVNGSAEAGGTSDLATATAEVASTPEAGSAASDDAAEGERETTGESAAAPSTAEDDGTSPADDATAAPVLDPDSLALILTEDGDVWSVGLLADGAAEPERIHRASRHDPATAIALVPAGLAVIDDQGDITIIDLDDPDERDQVWRNGRTGKAVQMVEANGLYGVLDATGSISVFASTRAATRFSIETVWDTAVGGTPPARSIDSYRDLLPFVVGNGNVYMIVTSVDGNPVDPIWDGSTQPRAFNLDMSEHGLLMGVGAGAVARFQWFLPDEPALAVVWDPSDADRLPAIGYAPIDESTAIVLNNGTVAMVDSDGDGPILWNAEIADLRAVSITATDDEALLLLDGGSVLRVDTGGTTENRGSIWDVTDESVSPAVQVLLTEASTG